jgi:hypothetical protein
LTRQIAKAYCSVAELYLTDLWLFFYFFVSLITILSHSYADNAEQSCELAVLKGLEFDSDSLDALQALGNLRLSQNRKEEASETMKKVYGKIQRLQEAVRARTIADDLMEAADSKAENNELEGI